MTQQRVYSSSDETNSAVVACLLELAQAAVHIENAGNSVYTRLKGHLEDPDSVVMTEMEHMALLMLLRDITVFREAVGKMAERFHTFDNYEDMVMDAVSDKKKEEGS